MTDPTRPNEIETTQLDIELDLPAPPDDVDPTALDIFRVVSLATEVLETIDEEGLSPGSAPPALSQEYIDALEDVQECGRELEARDDFAEFIRDVSVLDAEMLRELRGSVVYVGRHFGIEIELPAPGDGEA